MTRKRNSKNEHLKRAFAEHLKDARGRGETTIDDALAAILRFEVHIGFRDFKTYRPPQAQSFKRKLAETKASTGRPLSPATRASIMGHLRSFFLWLRERPGFKRISCADCEYFSLSRAEETMAAAVRPKVVPTLEQIRAVLSAMPDETPIEKRDRGLIAFLALTGVRADVIGSLRLRHVNIEAGFVDQDGREARTKFRKTFRTYFVPVGPDIRDAFDRYVRFLTQDLLRGPEDFLFPATELVQGPDRRFRPGGLDRRGWSGSAPVRQVVKPAFERVGLPYASPHRFRDMLVQFGMSHCQSAEAFRAFSMNLGHHGVLTTFLSYGEVPEARRAEIIANLGVDDAGATDAGEMKAMMAEVLATLKRRA